MKGHFLEIQETVKSIKKFYPAFYPTLDKTGFIAPVLISLWTYFYYTIMILFVNKKEAVKLR